MGSSDDDVARAPSRPAATDAMSDTLPNDRSASVDGQATADGRAGRVVAATPVAETISRFEIKGKLGEGGMGVVLLALDPLLGRRVALKVLHRDGGDDAAAGRRRLLREAQGMAQLSHDNVIVVHEVGTHDDQVYLAMEYVSGRTLTAWQADRTWREVLDVYLRAGRGLLAAHDAGLIHRDFKPDNVLVGDDGRVRVTDFGLVAAVATAASAVALSKTEVALRKESELAMPLTQTGAVMGTPRYMAPEQHLGEPIDPRADQFAFCVALYEALYGQLPFVGTTYPVMVAHVLAGDVVPVPTTSPVPAIVRDAVLRGLRRDRNERFPSMRELLAVLSSIVEPRPEPAHTRLRWLVPAAAVGAIALATVAYLVLAGSRDPRTERAAAGAAAVPRDEIDVQIALLADPEADLAQRRRAAHALAGSTDERAQEALWLTLRTEDDPEIREAARGALAVLIATLDAPTASARPATAATTNTGEPPWAKGVSAADKQAAQALFNAGNQAMSAGRFTEAADHYRAAVTRWNHPGIQYNLALALVNLERPREMDAALDAALAYGAAPLGGEERFARAKDFKRLTAQLLAGQPDAGR